MLLLIKFCAIWISKQWKIQLKSLPLSSCNLLPPTRWIFMKNFVLFFYCKFRRKDFQLNSLCEHERSFPRCALCPSSNVGEWESLTDWCENHHSTTNWVASTTAKRELMNFWLLRVFCKQYALIWFHFKFSRSDPFAVRVKFSVFALGEPWNNVSAVASRSLLAKFNKNKQQQKYIYSWENEFLESYKIWAGRCGGYHEWAEGGGGQVGGKLFIFFEENR